MNRDESLQKVSVLVTEWFAGDSDGAMFDAYTEKPEIAWQAVLEILKRELTDDQEALLAAGPLEGLLSWHGESFIDRIEAEAKANAHFNYLLGGVWRQDMPQEIWTRIEKVRKEVW